MNTVLIEPNDAEAIAEVDRIEARHATKRDIHQHLQNRPLSAAVTIGEDAISAACRRDYHAAHSSGLRPTSAIKYVVIHDTEGGTAKSVASYFSTENSGGSTQLVVDDISCYRTLGDNEIPWGAPGANYAGFHIEQCGYASWSTSLWSGTHRKTLMRAAYKAAFHCKKFSLPPVFVDSAGLSAGERGITTHAECTKAFGGTHTDPGANWPRLLFMGMVKAYYLKIKIRGK